MLEQIKASAGSGKTYTLTRRFLQLLAGLDVEGQENGCAGACHLPVFPSAGQHTGLSARQSLQSAQGLQNYRGLQSLPGQREGGVFSEILAMTFTNKAASEMKSRVVETLKDFVLFPDKAEQEAFSPGQAAAWLRVILKHYDSLNIRTIDSLLTLLVRLCAVRLGVAPDFEVVFDNSVYFEPLYDELLNQASAGTPEVLALFEACAEYYTRRENFRGFTPRDGIRAYVLEALLKAQEAGIAPCADEKLIHSRLADVSKQLIQTASQLEKLLSENQISLLQHFRTFLEKCLKHTPGTDFPASKYAAKPSLRECVLTKSKDLITDQLETVYAELSAVLSVQERRNKFYRSALELLPFAKACEFLMPRLNELRESSGKLTGNMLPGLASEALGSEFGVSEACCRLGSRLSHLLIDEFQDTSRTQWQAILPLAEECLSRGGSLRYVGDVKQAIYSWRGGDSSLFDEVSSLPELRSMEPEPLFTPLEYNWRSAPQIIRHNNTFFARLAEEEVSLAAAGALLPASYPPEELARAAAIMRNAFAGAAQRIPPCKPDKQDKPDTPDKVEGFVSMRRLDMGSAPENLPDDSPAGDSAANGKVNAEEFRARVAAALRELFSTDLLPRRKPGDIAVLVRSGDEAELVAEQLLELGVGIVTEHSFKLGLNPLIRRLVAFLHFMDYPNDDLNFWDFISGPECFTPAAGLQNAALDAWLAKVCLERKTDERLRGWPLYKFFQRDFSEVWLFLLEPFHNQAGLMSAYDAISELYDRYALFTRQAGQAVYLRRFLEVLHHAGGQGHSSPAAFLNFWADKGSEEKIPMPETPDAVRIMTMHKAKGLEFPVVVMPFHRFSDSNQAESCMFEFEGQTWLVKESPALGDYYYAKKRTAALEKLHLLYVGWTRASEELHLFVGGADYDRATPGLPRALDYLLDIFAFDENGCYQSGTRPAGSERSSGSESPERLERFTSSGSSASSESHIYELDEDWRPMRWLPRLKIFRNPVPETVYDERTRGIFLHACLENLYLPEANQTENNIPNDTLSQSESINTTMVTASALQVGSLLERCVRNAVDYTLQGFPLPFSDMEQAKTEAVQSLFWLCAQAGPRRWLQKGRRECSLLDEQGNLRRVDLLVEEANALLVVEYKSGKPQTQHYEQIKSYLALLDKSQAAKENSRNKALRGALVYLDERRIEFIDFDNFG